MDDNTPNWLTSQDVLHETPRLPSQESAEKCSSQCRNTSRVRMPTQRWPAHTVSSTARRSRVISTSSPTAMTPRCDVTCARRSALVTGSPAPSGPCQALHGTRPGGRPCRRACLTEGARSLLEGAQEHRTQHWTPAHGVARPCPHASPPAMHGALLLPADGCSRERRAGTAHGWQQKTAHAIDT